MPVAEQVDARRGRRAEREVPLPVHLAHTWRGEVREIRDRLGSTFLREPEQPDENLRGRLCVGQRAMTGGDSGAEEVRERRESEPRAATGQQAPREPDGVDNRAGQARPDESLRLAVEERQVEARIVRDEHGVAGEAEEPAHRGLGPRSAP